MTEPTAATTRTICRNCGFDTPEGTDDWDVARHPTLGSLTQCPECGSTDTTSQ